MSRNIEIKARIDSVSDMEELVAALATSGPHTIFQDDTFFRCANGRLKLREFGDGTGQLIFYRRADERGPRESFYLISETDAPDALRDVLAHACGQLGRVRKQRLLYMIGRTRVHLDVVDGLGHFLELEVVLEDGEPLGVGQQEADTLIRQLGIWPNQLVEGAYFDLVAKQ